MEQSTVGWSDSSKSPEKELTWLIPISLQSGLNVLTPGHDVLKKVDLLGCTKWDPADQQKVWKISVEYADVFAKDDLDLGQTLLVKHKITLKEGAKPIKECYRRVPPGLYDEV